MATTAHSPQERTENSIRDTFEKHVLKNENAKKKQFHTAMELNLLFNELAVAKKLNPLV
jgi:hypothetical protein